MSKSETPITDAVAQAQAEGGLVEWQITVSSHSKTGYSAKLQAQGECFMVTEFKYLSESDNLSWQRGSHADAAAALRLAAEKLSPDPTRRALEIAANLAAHLLLEDLEYFERFRFGATVLVLLYDLDSAADMAKWAPQNWVTIRVTIGHIDELVTAPETKHWLQQARDFFEQAEAAKSEGETRDE